MTRAADCLDQTLKRLHAVEDALEHENALNPDPRLSMAEIALHACITDVERAKAGLGHDYESGGICRTDSYGCPR